MPATEQTWRDSKLLHVVFGISSLAMLITTIWMLAADHRREWKDYQRKFQQVETWTTQARISQQESDQYHAQLTEARTALEQARQVVPERDTIDQFEQAVAEDAEARHAKEPNFAETIERDYAALAKAPADERPPLRDRLRDDLGEYIKSARFREDKLATEKKFLAAELDVARSQYELAVGNALPKSKLGELQKAVDNQMQSVAEKTDEVQDAITYRKRLESIVAEISAAETDDQKIYDDLKGQLVQLEKARDERENSVMKEFTELPIIDAFGRPIKIEQIWLPKLTINYNFGAVGDIARFDRCITCHQGMDKTAPGSAIDPAYPSQRTVILTMQTPGERPAALADRPADPAETQKLYDKLLEETYGLQLAPRGLFNENDAMVSVVRPETPAARAELQVGDVVVEIGDARLLDKRQAYNYLIETVAWGKPLKLTVRRGLPHPFASHPRLDLFVGSLSPHKMADIGCTICHDGQGSATAFKWASHSPNDPLQESRWKRDHGWFDNHHWIYPIYPKRFAESLCLKCHHDVVELEKSERFPDPPAPKLVEGLHLIEDFGCFGCHEINGYDGPNKRVGPDLRAEPNYAPAAQAMLATGGLTEQQRGWAAELVRQPSNDAARHLLSQSLRAAEPIPGQPEISKKLVNLLDDVETPGKLRKVGPSLRHVASKVNFNFLYSWIKKPSDFRPSTKMPQFFGLEKHLDGKGLDESHRFEPIEIRAASEYLLAKSQPFEFTPRPKSVTVEASSERGKQLFEVRGCLACHKHDDFPKATQTQGPDLSRIGAKLAAAGNKDGGRWLYTWLRNPLRYHARTVMPNLFLDPIEDAEGKLTDPAADVAIFLLGSKGDWEPTGVPERKLDGEEQRALTDLALEYLKTVFTRKQAEEYLKTGIPASRAGELKGDEVELVGEMSDEKQLQYVGRRTISKYGCAGCHDVPGFEDAKPIGTGLADWARKTADKLAFEQIVEYMKQGHGAPGPLIHEVAPRPADVSDQRIEEAEEMEHGHEEFNFLNLDPDTGYFMEKLVGHQREGFIWQKLREPRSYDYKKTQNKSYNERLRMPQFTALDDQQREAIITFVLGLVAEPPASQYVYRPNPRRAAIAQGMQVLEKFNCGGCHTLGLEQWKLAYEPGDFPDPPEIVDYPFLEPHFTPAQITASLETDARGLRHATLVGMPMVNELGEPMRLDEDGAPLDAEDKQTVAVLPFAPWENVLINGQARPAGLQNLLVPESRIEKRYPPHGGFLSRFAYPVVVAAEKAVNPNAKSDEAWGWLPPPLVGEGKKVQTEWLHNFLLDPFPIRPAVVLRMPKFNMSPADATALVNYFAAADGAEYPYDFDPRTRESYLAEANASHPDRLGDALKIVTDGNYCVKCHLIGDYDPPGSERAKAPHLDAVYKRIRPDFMLRWVANPKRLLPYTGMPVNIPPDKPVSQALFKGTNDQQLNAVVDLLLNYDHFAESKTSIKPMVKPVPPEAAQNRPGTAEGNPAQ
jgi:mono/diheme cytochrome c family protein